MKQGMLFDDPPRKPVFNRPLGKTLAALGAERAADKADRENDGCWQDQAWEFFVDFAIARRGKPFMTEDVRASAAGIVPAPPDGRAWGAIVLRAVKGKLIRRIGFAPMKSANCHANPKSVWVWVGGQE